MILNKVSVLLWSRSMAFYHFEGIRRATNIAPTHKFSIYIFDGLAKESWNENEKRRHENRKELNAISKRVKYFCRWWKRKKMGSVCEKRIFINILQVCFQTFIAFGYTHLCVQYRLCCYIPHCIVWIIVATLFVIQMHTKNWWNFLFYRIDNPDERILVWILLFLGRNNFYSK